MSGEEPFRILSFTRLLRSKVTNVDLNLSAFAGVLPPDSHPRENLLVVSMSDGSDIILCANSEDEAL